MESLSAFLNMGCVKVDGTNGRKFSNWLIIMALNRNKSHKQCGWCNNDLFMELCHCDILFFFYITFINSNF